MPNVTLTWTKSPVGTPTEFHVVWTRNGVALALASVPVSGDSYSIDFNSTSGLSPAAPGDVIGATVQAHDHANNLLSGVVPSSPATVTIPAAPVAPGDPVNVTLALS